MSVRAPRVSVVVPTRDRPDRLRGCLSALAAQTFDDFEIVVVDDRSRDAAAVAAAAGSSDRARLVQGAGRGPAAARNLGAGTALGEVIAFTDDDCRPCPGWLEAIVQRIDEGADVVAGPTLNGRPDDVWAAASQTITNHLTDSTLDADAGRVRFAPTSNIACRAEVWNGHRFDETFPLAAGEDREWCARLVSDGIVPCFAAGVRVSHHQDLSPGRFWRQQFRYGRGGQRHARRAPDAPRMQPGSFYVALVRRGFAQGPAVGALVVLAQLATAAGAASEAVDARRNG